jgi:hypothetical protein
VRDALWCMVLCSAWHFASWCLMFLALCFFMLSALGTLLLYVLHSWHSTSLCLVIGAFPTLYFSMFGAHGTLFLFA